MISPTLSRLVNRSMSKGIFPNCLKIAKLIPLFKKGSTLMTGNYRPISILHFISKIYEKIMNKGLLNFLKKFNLLTECQFGFQRNISTADAILRVTDAIYESFNSRGHAASVFLDLQKAFDTVQHDILIGKLERLGIRGTQLYHICKIDFNTFQ